MSFCNGCSCQLPTEPVPVAPANLDVQNLPVPAPAAVAPAQHNVVPAALQVQAANDVQPAVPEAQPADVFLTCTFVLRGYSHLSFILRSCIYSRMNATVNSRRNGVFICCCLVCGPSYSCSFTLRRFSSCLV